MSYDDSISFEENWKRRVAEKEAARQKDEEDLKAGRITVEELNYKNGGGDFKVEYVGPSKLRKLAKNYD